MQLNPRIQSPRLRSLVTSMFSMNQVHSWEFYQFIFLFLISEIEVEVKHTLNGHFLKIQRQFLWIQSGSDHRSSLIFWWFYVMAKVLWSYCWTKSMVLCDLSGIQHFYHLNTRIIKSPVFRRPVIGSWLYTFGSFDWFKIARIVHLTE